MAGIGTAPQKARGYSGTLTAASNPIVESTLAGIGKLDANSIMDTRAWGNALVRSLDIWCAENRRRNPLREPARDPVRQSYQGGTRYGS